MRRLKSFPQVCKLFKKKREIKKMEKKVVIIATQLLSAPLIGSVAEACTSFIPPTSTTAFRWPLDESATVIALQDRFPFETFYIRLYFLDFLQAFRLSPVGSKADREEWRGVSWKMSPLQTESLTLCLESDGKKQVQYNELGTISYIICNRVGYNL